MAYSWQFRIMEFGGEPPFPPKHLAEQKYMVRQEINQHLASHMSLTDALAYDFVPDDVKQAVRTVMGCHRFNPATRD